MSGELIASFELNLSTQIQSTTPVQVAFRMIMYDDDEPPVVDFLLVFFCVILKEMCFMFTWV